MSEQPVKPKRRWLRFSLRTLFVLLTVACVLIGWKANKAHQQREVVEWVREMGGYVQYEYEFDANGFDVTSPKPPAPAWLRNLIGIDFFSEVMRVYLSKQVSDLTPLARLANLEVLFLDGTQVTDVTPLAKLINLKFLWLDGAKVSDVTPLANLTSLESLSLANTQVSDVTPLARLANLRTLWLNDTQVSNVTPLAKLTNLENLWLVGTKVSVESLQQLRKALPHCNIYRYFKP